MDRGMVQVVDFQYNSRIPMEMIPWKIYDGMYRMYDHATGPFLFGGMSGIKADIAWHSRFQVVYPHTRNFRMMRAITTNDLEEIQKVAKEMEKAGVSIDSSIDKKYGLNALQYAAVTNKFPIMEYLLLLGADPNAKNKLGLTALMLTAMTNNLESAHTLTKNGCDVMAKDKYGKTALDMAKVRMHIPLRDFLEAQAKKNIERPFPVFKLRMPGVQGLFNNTEWKFLNKYKAYSGRVVLSPFNTLRGLYSVSFTNYRTMQQLADTVPN